MFPQRCAVACSVEFHHALQFLCFELSVVAVAGQWTLFFMLTKHPLPLSYISPVHRPFLSIFTKEIIPLFIEVRGEI